MAQDQRILIVDDDDARAARVRELLARPGRRIAAVATLAEAKAREAADPAALVVVAQALAPSDAHPAWLVVPDDALDHEVQAAAERALGAEEGFTGHLAGISLVDLLQVFHVNRRSVVLDMGGDPPARIWFEDGDIVHAEQGPRSGEGVLHDLLEVRSGDLRTLPYDPAHPRSIQRSFQSVVLDAARVRDERRRDSGEWLATALVEERLELSDSDFTAPEPLRGPPAPPAAPAPIPVADLLPASPSDRPALDGRPPAPALAPLRSLDALCGALMVEVPGGVAAALVDLGDGALLGMHSRTDFSPDFERFLAQYTHALFRGPEVRFIEERLRQDRGIPVDEAGYLEEVVLTSRHTHHLIRVIGAGRIAAVVVVPRRADVQASLQKLRGLQRGLERNCP